MYGFIIDTNSYSGNFERELCAYMTGHTGDCGVGSKEAEQYLENHSKIEGVLQTEDSEYSSFFRPVEICTTPGVWNNGLGFHFSDGEEEIALKKYQEYQKESTEKQIAIAESHRGKNYPTWTDEAIDNAVIRYQKELDDAMKKTEVEKYPAYQSVLIHFSSIPNEETVEFMKKRAYQYGKKFNISITGFRITERKISTLL